AASWSACDPRPLGARAVDGRILGRGARAGGDRLDRRGRRGVARRCRLAEPPARRSRGPPGAADLGLLRLRGHGVGAARARRGARGGAAILADEWARESGRWTQHLYGRVRRFLGPVHGFAGNVHALRGFLDDGELRSRVGVTLERYAVHEDGLVNWPPVDDAE